MSVLTRSIETVDDFNAVVARIESQPAYQRPSAFAVGIATYAGDPAAGAARVLDTYYPVVNLAENFGSAAVLASVVGHTAGSHSYMMDHESVQEALAHFRPFFQDGKRHANVAALRALLDTRLTRELAPGVVVHRRMVATFIGDLNSPPVDTHDVYLRLHLLSSCKVRPHGQNLDGIFGLLNNVVWTSLGPFDPETFEEMRLRLRAAGLEVQVHGVDKFPRMTDYVIPGGVRIADASRVRLGAHLADGTTVMHEGFCNFNAGTLGKSMVEGRISAGVVVGDGSDVGGGASIMGTLSGGGKEVIRVGEGCLLGANSGLGISLGDGCTVEAGLYVTAGSKVQLPDGRVVKAAELSGRDDLLFRRNSQSGAIEVIAKRNQVVLNEALHAKQ